MKRLIILGFALSSFNAQSQSILNGSFESTSASASCNYNISNATYNSAMNNSTAFGLYQQTDIVVSGCYIPSIPDGQFSVGIANNPSNNVEGEAISLELSAPLVIGNAYEISFQAYANTDFGPQGDLVIGVSTANNSLGTVIDTANTVIGTWTSFTVNFTATDNSTYITVAPVQGISSWNFVDDFSITEVCTATSSTETITSCGAFTWSNGVTYENSTNTATDTLVNAAGCDSIVTLDLTINPTPINSVTQVGTMLTADQAGATYQWLDCETNFSVIVNETNQSYTPLNTGEYAVQVDLNGCVDTSTCYLVDYTGIDELSNGKKELVKIVDFLGREVKFQPNMPLIFMYSDGTIERVMEIQY